MTNLIKNNYIRQQGVGDNFHIEIDQLPIGGNYYEESALAAEEVYNFRNGKLHILYSGGIDSEFVLNLFLHLGMEIIPVIIDLKPNYNNYDIRYALEFCKSKNINPIIIDIDFDKFVKSGQILDIARESRSSIYQRPATAWAASQINGTVLFGDGEPYIRLNEKTNTWNLEIDENDYSIQTYLTNRNIPCVPHFNRYRPEMLSAFMLDARMKELADHKHPGKLGSNSSKHIIYNRHSPFKLVERQKYTGYEKIEKSEIFKNPIFSQLHTEGLLYNGSVLIDYHKFIKEYINV
jgi:hypothetical protein